MGSSLEPQCHGPKDVKSLIIALDGLIKLCTVRHVDNGDTNNESEDHI